MRYEHQHPVASRIAANAIHDRAVRKFRQSLIQRCAALRSLEVHSRKKCTVFPILKLCGFEKIPFQFEQAAPDGRNQAGAIGAGQCENECCVCAVGGCREPLTSVRM